MSVTVGRADQVGQSTRMRMPDLRADVVVVGSGLAGLNAAVTAHELGLSVAILEKGDKFGGATANSGGQVWVGANHVAARDGLLESCYRAGQRDAHGPRSPQRG